MTCLHTRCLCLTFDRTVPPNLFAVGLIEQTKLLYRFDLVLNSNSTQLDYERATNAHDMFTLLQKCLVRF